MNRDDDVTIRPATRADVDDIVRLLADDPLGHRRERYERPLPRAYVDAFEAIDRDPNQELVVVEGGGAVIGTLQLTIIPYLTYQGRRRAQIEAVRIDRAHRGRGLGERLFAWAVARARARGCHVVQLTTDKGRPDAQRFYERLGFVASHHGMKLHLAPADGE